MALETLADRLEALASRLADSGAEKIEAASLRDTVAAAGVCVEKAYMLRSKVNGNDRAADSLRLSDLTDEELEQRLAEAEGRAAAPLVSA